jgi:hypothetical protein
MIISHITVRGINTQIARILRVVSALKFVDEVGENQWTSNEVTKVMCRPEAYAAHIHKFVLPSTRVPSR